MTQAGAALGMASGDDPGVTQAGAALGLTHAAAANHAGPVPQPFDATYFARSVHDVARDLIGCTLVVGECAGIIVETEAYAEDDPACHAFGGRTPRNTLLFGPPGVAYVYLSYGVHKLMNVVCESDGSAAAVLIRALEPVEGIELMQVRRGRRPIEQLCSGPGKLAQALGIGLEHNGVNATGDPFSFQGPVPGQDPVELISGPRIGISRATELPWRHSLEGSRFVSRPRPGGVAGLSAAGVSGVVGVSPG